MFKKFLIIILSVLFIATTASCKPKEENNNPKVVLNISNGKQIKIELYPDIAPVTVENFLSLVDDGFYTNAFFHRIIDGFMIQGGDPLGNGTGGSSKSIKGEYNANGFQNNLKHERGVISMARSPYDYNSARSQFFIVQTTYPSLDGLYASFGKVIKGIEIVDKICKETKVEDDNGTTLKENQPVITKVYIVDEK